MRAWIAARLTHPRLAWVMAAVLLLVLALPLVAVLGLRVYQSALIRQTESELIGQSALLAAAYAALAERYASPQHDWRTYGQPAPGGEAGVYGELHAAPTAFAPRPAALDLALHGVEPPAPLAAQTPARADALALRTGQDLRSVLLQTQRITLAGLRVFSAQGVIVASTGEDVGQSMALPEVWAALRGKGQSRLRQRTNLEGSQKGMAGISRNTGIRVMVTAPITHRGRVIGAVLAMRTPVSLGQVALRQWKLIAISAAALLLATLGLAWLTATTLATPLQRLTEQAQDAQHGVRGAIQPPRRRVVREVAQLTRSLSAMADALAQRADYIQHFAAHVSHEFKTPLTAMQGAAELLIEHGDDMEPAERARFLAIIRGDAERLSTLTRRLLDLARADMARPQPGQRTMLASLTSTLASLAVERGQQVDATAVQADAAVALDADTLGSIVQSLLDNAAQHAPGAAVRLHTPPSPAGLWWLDVQDAGPGVSAGNADKVFDPFFTTARAAGNTGLGLPIARALLRAHGGALLLTASPQGACWRVVLPAA